MALISKFIEDKKNSTRIYVEEWQGTVYSMLLFVATLLVMFWASVFLYTSFYFTYMPQESVTWPIHFQYKSCGDERGVCSNPEAVVPVTDPARGSLLARGQKYRVVMDMHMPESTRNQLLGMFMVSMDMHSQGGSLMRTASRSTMLRYKSFLLQGIETLFFSPVYLYGVNEEKQTVTVELFNEYEEDPVTPLSEVRVQLHSRHVELYGATLRIHAVFSGLRYVMYHYPVIAAVLGIGVCMVFLSALVLFSWYQFSGAKTEEEAAPASLPNGPSSKPGTTHQRTQTRLVETRAVSSGGDAEEETSSRKNSDDFEVVSSSSKDPVDEKGSKATRSFEDGADIRQRIQTISQS